ncbi:sigma-70 family RNA polymerase sigma factor [Sphingobacterium phlebotomi]|jgi:RNA polymerase sigma factor (sigma-70 family)|uniref:Sigma-70 family RNA polymerase sigma factor n=1 Tax=Sphingobacterium phlebotomi TaxID=2605433 RepID=A0A5D4H6S5_9SPHI|nr:sigma-70 family RNA polymerase sigma factor [Sphingobacterium phlebotomi]TYR35953.1 sigma-70 family RNA polymerase sigma factor [Sphingobacterium phlebotomi]HLT88844.1 sigma-70 family RNA polymerase sigma factor [Sphingobacterium sp.]
MMRSKLSDEKLVSTLNKGSVEAFRSLYDRYNRPVYANVLKMVRQPEYAEDILQEVFVALWEHRSTIKSNQSVGGWLFVVSFNKATTFLKRKLKESLDYVEEYTDYEHILPEETVNEEEYLAQWTIVEEAVNALPSRKKEVFKLCRFEGKAKEEVASMMGISTVSVKDYLKQSNRAIKDYITLKYPHLYTAIVITSVFSDKI